MQVNANSPNVSTATQALLEHLSVFPRRALSSLLLEQKDPLKFLVSGRARHQLQRQIFPRAAKKPFRFSAWQTVGYFDPNFPAALKSIPDPPLVLFYRGDLKVLTANAIAVVGARRCTHSGRAIARLMASDLSQAGVHIVSGLAYGIDAAAHAGALSAGGGAPTVAVLGGGLKRVYPRRHQPLLEQMLRADGLILSEYPDDVSPRPYHFPERNRLISGLSKAVVVVEANLHSGSLITARFAAEQGRDVMAVPGAVANETSKGCHQLIKEGAALVTCANDVLENLAIDVGLNGPTANKSFCATRENLTDVSTAHPLAAGPTGEMAQTVYASICGEPVTVDELMLRTQLSSAELSQVLVTLELAGFVEQGPLGYIRTSF